MSHHNINEAVDQLVPHMVNHVQLICRDKFAKGSAVERVLSESLTYALVKSDMDVTKRQRPNDTLVIKPALKKPRTTRVDTALRCVELTRTGDQCGKKFTDAETKLCKAHLHMRQMKEQRDKKPTQVDDEDSDSDGDYDDCGDI